MKDYMMIFFGADYGELKLTPEQINQRMGAWFGWNEKMEKMGVLVGGNALQSGGVHISGSDRVVSDGPFVEGKELIGGYYIVKAENIENVKEIAQDFPDFDLGGTVEIREVMVFE